MGDVWVIEVTDQVPANLATTIAASDRALTVALRPPPHLAGDALVGWEIGAATAALLAGATEVTGIDARQLARVRAVVAHLQPAAEPAR